MNLLAVVLMTASVGSGLTTKLSDSRRRAPGERRGGHQITRDSQTESATAVRCSALVRSLHLGFSEGGRSPFETLLLLLCLELRCSGNDQNSSEWSPDKTVPLFCMLRSAPLRSRA